MASKQITVTIPEMRVHRNQYGEYIIQEHRQETLRKRWVSISRGYEHKTSADAAYGRLVQQAIVAASEE